LTIWPLLQNAGGYRCDFGVSFFELFIFYSLDIGPALSRAYTAVLALMCSRLNITSDLVETQLLAIAGIVMIQNLTKPSSPFQIRANAEAFREGAFR